MQVERSVERALLEWQKYVRAYKVFLEFSDKDEDFYDNYWNDEVAAFGWQRSKENPENLLLVYELATGGPNAHLVFVHKITEEYADYVPEIEHIKTEFQYHWWSPVSTLDLTKVPKDAKWATRELFDTAETCLEQINEEALSMLENNFTEILSPETD